jgi:hypothetical protein
MSINYDLPMQPEDYTYTALVVRDEQDVMAPHLHWPCTASVIKYVVSNTFIGYTIQSDVIAGLEPQRTPSSRPEGASRGAGGKKGGRWSNDRSGDRFGSSADRYSPREPRAFVPRGDKPALQHAVTSQPTHLAVTSRLVIASALLRHAVIVQRLLRAATSPLSPHVVMLLAVTPHAVIVLSVVTASATLHRAVTSLPSRRVATSLLAANVPVATIHTPAHALIAPHQTALPTQVSQRAQRVISHLAPLHLVAKPSLLAATVQHALAHRAQAHHVPQPVHAAALTLTAVAVKAAR